MHFFMKKEESHFLFTHSFKPFARILLFLSIIFFIAVTAFAQKTEKQKPILIEEQGSFAVGGTVISNPGIF